MREGRVRHLRLSLPAVEVSSFERQIRLGYEL